MRIEELLHAAIVAEKGRSGAVPVVELVVQATFEAPLDPTETTGGSDVH